MRGSLCNSGLGAVLFGIRRGGQPFDLMGTSNVYYIDQKRLPLLSLPSFTIIFHENKRSLIMMDSTDQRSMGYLKRQLVIL